MYKARTIRAEAPELEKCVAILDRVSRFLIAPRDGVMPIEEQKQILGDDEYLSLSIHAVGYFLDDHTPEELIEFINEGLSKIKSESK